MTLGDSRIIECRFCFLGLPESKTVLVILMAKRGNYLKRKEEIIMNKSILLVILFIVGFGIGALVKSNIPKSMSAESRISYYNWISRYDLYDYEEAPYLIIMYDVHKRDMCDDMLTFYNLYNEGSHEKDSRAFIPLRRFLEKIITDTIESGFHVDPYDLKNFEENE